MLVVVEMLREKGVVGKFVEFHGEGLASLSLADRATIANMAPEYGATCGIFPIDGETLSYLELTGREKPLIERVEAYAKAQGLWREDGAAPAEYTDTLELDLADVRPSIAGPKRPQDRIALDVAARTFREHLTAQGELAANEAGTEQTTRYDGEGGERVVEQDGEATAAADVRVAPFELDGEKHDLSDGDVVIAAITSCTNTSNPSVMMAAGLLAKNARAKGLTRKPWVKTSLAPGSQVVPRYLEDAGLLEPLRELGFHVVGFGCTTCIGNSGPLPESISRAINDNDLIATSVLSGNRNFEGRIQPGRQGQLPRLAAVGGRLCDRGLHARRRRQRAARSGRERQRRLPEGHLAGREETVKEAVSTHVTAALFRDGYDDVFEGAKEWRELDAPDGHHLRLARTSTYVKKPALLRRHGPEARGDRRRSRTPAAWSRSATRSPPTTSPRPARSSRRARPASTCRRKASRPATSTATGSRRGNHEVMMRGTFANVRLKNQLAPGTEGSATRYLPDGEPMNIYAAGMMVPGGGRAAGGARRARSTARARAATGRRRARGCSGSRRSSPRATSASTART